MLEQKLENASSVIQNREVLRVGLFQRLHMVAVRATKAVKHLLVGSADGSRSAHVTCCRWVIKKFVELDVAQVVHAVSCVHTCSRVLQLNNAWVI